MEERQRFEQIARELASGRMKEGTWARALAEADSDPQRARSLYVRMRNDQLSARSGTSAADAELTTLRGELTRALKRSRHGSLYASIGLTADASDEQIATTLTRLRVQGMTAEMRYAADILAVPSRRADYDRRLLSQVLPGMGAAHDFSVLDRHRFRPLMHGSMLLIALALLAWLAIALIERGGEIQQQARVEFEARRRATLEAEARQQQSAEAARYRMLRERAGGTPASDGAPVAAGEAAAGARAAQNALDEGDAPAAQPSPSAADASSRVEARPLAEAPHEPASTAGPPESEAPLLEAASGDYWRCLNQALNEMSGAQAKEKCAPLR